MRCCASSCLRRAGPTNTPPQGPTSWSGEKLPDDTVLLVPVPFDALYPHVLCARIDAALGETDRYAGEQAQCSGLLSELAVWLRQKHPPRCRAQWRW